MSSQLKPGLILVFRACFLPDLDDPIVTVHQSIGEAKEQFYYEKTVFLRCVANSNPPVRYSWRRGQEVLLQGSDKGVEIYEPFFTQVGLKIRNFSIVRLCNGICPLGLWGGDWGWPLDNSTSSKRSQVLLKGFLT